jgi:hypothetical protein
MALFPLSPAEGGILRGFSPATYENVRLGGNPCAALLREKTAHFWIGNSNRYPSSKERLVDGHYLDIGIKCFLETGTQPLPAGL